MTPEQIDSLVAEGESETLEFKSSTGRRREAAKTMCAMLNARGGYVLFGVTPEGKAVGVQTGDRTVENVAAEIQRIEPPVFPGVERVRINDNREVIAVRVSPGPVKPYVYRGAAYRRVGNTTLTLSPDEYNRMLFERMHNEQRWENQPAAGWGIEDLDVDEIRAVAAEAVRRGRLTEPGSREPAELLRGMGLYRNGVLWRAAAVLFGAPDRVEFEMPQCKLRVARFQGNRPYGVLGQPAVLRQRLHPARKGGSLPARHPSHRGPVRAGPLRADRPAPLPASGDAGGDRERLVPPRLLDRRGLRGRSGL